MRELVFNDACLRPRATSIESARTAVLEAARGMASVVDAKLVKSTLRMRIHFHECVCTDAETLWDIVHTMQKGRAFPEEVRFLMRLAQKVPLLVDLPPEVVGRFNGCQPIAPVADGDALVYCAHTDGIAVSLAFDGRWATDSVAVSFDEIDPSGEITRVEESIDHLSAPSHSSEILRRWRSGIRQSSDVASFWELKSEMFPNLQFGPDVAAQLANLNDGVFSQILKRLASLDEAGEEWKRIGGGAPRWRSKVSPESETRINDPVLRAKLSFNSIAGEARLFEWHARFGSAGRIHLRFDPAVRIIEIGYIGQKIT